jgi:transposase InsO family protein
VALAHVTGTGRDVVRGRAQLLAENALLRQQLLVLRRTVKRPVLTPADRALLVLLAGRVRAWRQALLIVRPDTLLRWHRAGFRAFWWRKSRPGPGRPPLAAETVALIRRLAAENPLWGAERIRGELGKLGIRAAKRTIQTYMPRPRVPRPRGQTWATFLRAHAAGIWACDFLPVTDLLFRPLFAFFVVELATRRVVHVGVTRHPTILRTPHRAPRANAVCERFLGSVRRECLDHLLILGERHLACVLREYVAYFNRARPHQGLGQALPESPIQETRRREGPICAVPVLGGLHHTYQRAA